MIEIIGYIAMGLVLISFLMPNLTTLRFVNSIGGMWFVFYGILLGSYPIIITNVLIVIINLSKIYNEHGKEKE